MEAGRGPREVEASGAAGQEASGRGVCVRVVQLGRQRGWSYVGAGGSAGRRRGLPGRHVDRQAARRDGRLQAIEAAVVLGGPPRGIDDERARRELRRRAGAVGQRAGLECHWRPQLGSGGRSISAVLAASLAVFVHDHGVAKGHASQASGPFHDSRLVGKRGVVLNLRREPALISIVSLCPGKRMVS